MLSKHFKLYFFLSFILIVIILFFFSPLFSIKDVEVFNCNITSSDKIRESLLLENKNIFMVTKKNIINTLKNNAYIKNATIEKKYPNKIFISITERKPSSYIKYTEDNYLKIDDEGTVISAEQVLSSKLPLVVGLEFDSFNVGQPLKVKNRNVFYIIVQLAQLLNEYDLISEVNKIDLTDLDKIHVYMYNIDFYIGNFNDIDVKIQKIKKVTPEIPNYKEIYAIYDLNDDVIRILT